VPCCICCLPYSLVQALLPGNLSPSPSPFRHGPPGLGDDARAVACHHHDFRCADAMLVAWPPPSAGTTLLRFPNETRTNRADSLGRCLLLFAHHYKHTPAGARHFHREGQPRMTMHTTLRFVLPRGHTVDIFSAKRTPLPPLPLCTPQDGSTPSPNAPGVVPRTTRPARRSTR